MFVHETTAMNNLWSLERSQVRTYHAQTESMLGCEIEKCYIQVHRMADTASFQRTKILQVTKISLNLLLKY